MKLKYHRLKPVVSRRPEGSVVVAMKLKHHAAKAGGVSKT